MLTTVSTFVQGHSQRAMGVLYTMGIQPGISCRLGISILMLALTACATTPAGNETNQPAVSSTEKPTTDAAPTASKKNEEKASTTEDSTEVSFVAPQPEAKAAATPAETKPVRIEVSCKNEPYSKYEKQSRASIAKGLSATTAGTYGVGFRNLEEHKKWSETHGKLFSAVNQACSALSQCAKQHPKDKAKQCAKQASDFAQWQALAKDFAAKAKQAETSQPPIICSLPLALDDPARCFHAMGKSIDKACKSAACKETSDCWRGIGFLDYAINQAASACNFARQKLSECRGYMTAVQRRKDKFNRCQAMQKELKTTIIPVL